ncbi:MAG: hypothetical protein FJ088_07030 [Deltaproteobacteria bacterium]|nr:hypothetical protein [Deltaproteobacteria bacterium]
MQRVLFTAVCIAAGMAWLSAGCTEGGGVEQGTDALDAAQDGQQEAIEEIVWDFWTPDCLDQETCQQYEIMCADGSDNDGDGMTDCDDGDCKWQPPCAVKINEIYYDAPGWDTGKVFIELWGPYNASLDGFVLKAVNGNFKDIYAEIDLAGKKTAGDGYFVITQTLSDAALSALTDMESDLADLQNGPDSLVLYYLDKQVDAIGYGGEGAPVFEGAPAPAVSSGQSLSRDEHHTDTNDNSKDFSACLPAPRSSDKCDVAPPGETNCEDNIDNDSDGYTDCSDFDCSENEKCKEQIEVICNDGNDNDNDGNKDCDDEDCKLSASCVTSDKPILFIGPDEGKTLLLNLIEQSKTSIRLVMYQLSVNELEDAFVSAKKRGVDVKAILDQGQEVNKSAYNKFISAGIEVKWSSAQFPYMHQKSMIVDNNKVVVMSQNMNSFSMSSERNYGVIDFNPVHISEIEHVFNADWNGEPVNLPPTTDLVLSPINSKQKLLAMINGAKTKLDFEEMQFGDVAFQDAVVAKKEAGVSVRILLASPYWIGANMESGKLLKSKGIPVRYLVKPGIHSKLIVADGEKAFIGSTNLSYTSISKNRELGLIYSDKDMLNKINSRFEEDWSIALDFPE